MAEKLTKQEQTFVKEVVETGNQTQSVKEAYKIKDNNYAGVKGNRLIRKDKIKKAIKSIAETIPNELLTEKHLALLNKEEVIIKNNMITGEIEVIPTGQIDIQAVSKGLDMAYKIKGSYAPDRNININMSISSEQREKSKELVKKYLNE